MISEYVSTVEREEIRAPFIRLMYDEHRYCSVDDVMKAGDGHLPDTVCAAALAIQAARVPRAAWFSV